MPLITAAEPFKIIPEPDGTTHMVRDEVGVTILPDIPHKAFHRVGQRADMGASRWGVIDLPEHGVKIYIHGNHVVITGEELRPEFNVKDD